MMDVRDRMEEVGNNLEKGAKGLDDGKSLLGNYITKEEINACTSCNACVEACPVMINPLEIILEVRRYVSIEESGAPAQWNSMFQNIETSFAPWKFSNPWFGTVRGRAGFAFNNILFFGTGGLAFGELRATTFGVSESHTNAGWTLGAGAEMGIAQNWSAKIEYLYVDLANSNFVITGASNGYRFGLIRAGVNYRF